MARGAQEIADRKELTMTFYRIQAVDKNYKIHDMDITYISKKLASDAIASGQVIAPEWVVTLLVVESIEREVLRFVRQDKDNAFSAV